MIRYNNVFWNCTIKILTLIVQTFHISKMPHEGYGKLANPQLSITHFTCNCKARSSEC